MSRPLTYTPGRRYLVVGPAAGAMLADRQLAERIWPLVRDGKPITDVLAELLTVGLGLLPDLVLYEFDRAGLRVILRGDVSVTVESPDGSAETCTGRSRRTWMEQVFLGAVSGTVGEMTDDILPLQTGVALADAFSFGAQKHVEQVNRPSPFSLAERLVASTGAGQGRRGRQRSGSAPTVVSLFPTTADAFATEQKDLESETQRRR